jgi:hypothetical protein
MAPHGENLRGFFLTADFVDYADYVDLKGDFTDLQDDVKSTKS